MLRNLNIQRSPLWLYITALIFGVLAAWAALQGFYFLFLVPVALAFLFLGIIKTETFILLTGAMVPLSVNINDIGGGFGLALPTEPVFIFIFGMLVFRFLYTGGYMDKKILFHPLSLVIIMYTLWMWLSTIFSSMPVVSFKFSLARTWYIVIFYFTCVSIFRDTRKIHFFLKMMAVFTLALVFFVLVKHASEGFVRSSSYGVSWPFFPDHGMYAAAIAFCVTILAFYAVNGRVLLLAWSWLPVAGFFLLILLFGIVVSYTRATWLSLIVALGVFAMLKFRVRFKWLLSGLLLVAVMGIAKQDDILYALEANKQGSSDDIEGHVKSVSNITTDPSNLERINRWKCASRMVAERPLFGFGPGTFVFQYGVFQKSSELTIISTNSGDLGDAHSEYFSTLSEMGVPGFGFWLTIVLLSLSVGFRIIYNSPHKYIRITAAMVMLGLVTYYFHALLNNYSQYDKIAVPLWGFIAVLTALDLQTRREAK